MRSPQRRSPSPQLPTARSETPKLALDGHESEVLLAERDRLRRLRERASAANSDEEDEAESSKEREGGVEKYGELRNARLAAELDEDKPKPSWRDRIKQRRAANNS